MRIKVTGIVVLAVSIALGLAMALLWPQSPSAALQPVRSVSDDSIPILCHDLPQPCSLAIEALRPASLPVTSLPANSVTIKPDRKIVKPASKPPISRVTMTTQFKAESKNMTDVRTPLQVAVSMVGQHPSYADQGFWCAKAVDDWATQAGVKNWVSRPGPSALFYDALNDNRVHPLPQVGDMGFADLRDPSEKAPSDIPDVQIMHVFIVSAVNGDEYSTVEGNFDSSQLVVRNTRHVSDGFTVAFASFPS
jgi:hypothetical protein